MSIVNYDKWLTMSDEERSDLIHSWNPYEGEGSAILKQSFEKFKKIYGGIKGIQNLHCGLYHGGSLIIGVTTKKGHHVRLPKIFEGFPVIKLQVNKGVTSESRLQGKKRI